MAEVRGDRTRRMPVYRKARWLLGGASAAFGVIALWFMWMMTRQPDPAFVGAIIHGLLFCGGFAYAARTREVVVGSDGVFSPRVPFGERYVRWEDFDAVQVRERIVELRRGDAMVLKIDYADDPDELASIIAEERERHLERERVEPPRELDRADAPVGAFCRSVEARVDGADYRGAPLTPEVLIRVAEDAGIGPDVRVVAATVAARRGGEEMRARVRVLADSSANPGLVDAFDDAARGRLNDGALRRAQRRET